ncbi:hypothetical protein BJ912DRAFT_1063597 [Pholiota molesta]|nr:hypothetical protein BJ912DRAFT_1063597 [Pholiota molesta]
MTKNAQAPPASVASERLDSRTPARALSPSLSSIFTSAFTESAALPSLTTFVDGLAPTTCGAAAGNTDEQPRQSQPPTLTSGPPSSPILDIWGLMSAEGNSGTDSSQPPHHDAPSLPPPDLGSSFNAGHNSQSMCLDTESSGTLELQAKYEKAKEAQERAMENAIFNFTKRHGISGENKELSGLRQVQKVQEKEVEAMRAEQAKARTGVMQKEKSI